VANELILVVEDNDMSRKLIRDVSTVKGYTIVEGIDGIQRGAMRRLALRALLFVVLLLASFGTVSAECAWVLWSALNIPSTPGLVDADWRIDTAYPSMQECDAALAKEFVRLKGEGLETHYTKARTVFASKGMGQEITTTHYRCLPDTLDPRGPRGK
jgi:hypothetical protein